MRLLNDNILIRQQFKQASSVIITEDTTELDTVAEVVLVGPDVKDVKVVDTIVYSGRVGIPVKYNDEDLLMIKEYDVFGIK